MRRWQDAKEKELKTPKLVKNLTAATDQRGLWVKLSTPTYRRVDTPGPMLRLSMADWPQRMRGGGGVSG
jgi:hypothetical protein